MSFSLADACVVSVLLIALYSIQKHHIKSFIIKVTSKTEGNISHRFDGRKRVRFVNMSLLRCGALIMGLVYERIYMYKGKKMPVACRQLIRTFLLRRSR